jgi:serine/threonine-protein kinase
MAMSATAALEAWRGNIYARILGASLLISAAFIVYYLLIFLNIISQMVDLRYAVPSVFMLTLGIILARRFRAFHKRLGDYSTVLKLSFSSAQDLAPFEQAQIALAELLRILRAARAFIFLCRPDSLEQELSAGRDAQGNALLDPTAEVGYDEKLIAAVQKRRRPVVRQRRSGGSRQKQNGAHRSIVASPLLAGGRLLGVLYLETDERRPDLDEEDVEILLGLGSQIALTLTATRAGQLQRETLRAQKRLEEQRALLEAAARMAGGDLQSPIVVSETSPMASLAETLESMRKDLRTKLGMLESSHAAMQRLNEDLRFQLDQRLHRLLELSLLNDKSSALLLSSNVFSSGMTLCEHYWIMSVLAQDAGGTLYEVKRTTDDRLLAAKLISRRVDKTATMKFATEAQTLARLNHPNIISIVDVDITSFGSLLLVMELLRGTPLSQCRERRSDLTFIRTVLRQIAAGLRAVHACGIVHRDLKPDSVIINEADGKPRLKLLGFGVSTLTDCAMGVPAEPVGAYTAPELVASAPSLSPAVDIFSWGAIAYELLFGEVPTGKSSTVARAPDEPPLRPLPDRSRGNLPPLLTILVDRCIATDPASRPTAAEILNVLDGLAAM